MKALLPNGLKKYLKNLLGIQFLQDQNALLSQKVAQLETKLYQSREDLEQEAKHRWNRSSPDKGLTWGQELKGNNFISRARTYDLFGPRKNILEIGPGYGRLVIAMEEEGIDYAGYLGVDISANQVKHLNDKFANDKRQFIHADAETFTTEREFDLLISSLTFKHMFPSFKKAMKNIGQHMKPGGMGFIDFIEGEKRFFEADGSTFIRHYSQEELKQIMLESGFEVLDFDVVVHAEGFSRMVVIARKM